MKAQLAQEITLATPQISKNITSFSGLSPQKTQKQSLRINDRPIPLHIIRTRIKQNVQKQVNDVPQFWGCIVPQQFKYRRRALSHQPVHKQTQMKHTVDRSHLLYSRFLKAKPVRILIRSSTQKGKRKTQQMISTRHETTISRSECKTANHTARDKAFKFNPQQKWQKNGNTQVMKKYDSVERRTSNTGNIRARIRMKGSILDYLQRGMRAIRNDDDIDFKLLSQIKKQKR